MAIRTDLAVESFAQTPSPPEGITVREQTRDEVKITRVEIQTEQAARQTGKPVGAYITVELSDFKSVPQDFEREVETTASELRQLLPPDGAVLVAGLGNADITPDAIGPLAASMIFATRHIPQPLAEQIGLQNLRPLAAITPGVLGRTGMETGEIIASLVHSIRPAAVIAIDALAAHSVDRLGRTVQLSDTGIIPGSGVKNARKALNREGLGVPVVSVGVPTVAEMASLLGELSAGAKATIPKRAQGMMITPKEIDVIAERAAKLTAYAVNRAVLPELSFQTLEAMLA